MDHDSLQRLGGERRRLGSHDACALAGEPALWLVASGSVAVFCATLAAGEPVGPRRFLFRGGRGSAIAVAPVDSSPAAGASPAAGLLAVPVEDTELAIIPLASFWDALQDDAAATEPLVSGWVEALAGQLSELPAPRDAARVEQPRSLTLSAGEGARAAATGLWLVVEDGEVDVRGESGWRVTAADGPTPCTEAAWVRAAGTATVRFVTAREVGSAAALGAGLARLQRIVLADLAHREALEEDAERARLRERARRSRTSTATAASELAGSFDRRRLSPQRATPLLTAVGAILETFGVDVQPAGASDRGRRGGDEVDAIARASGVRVRRVLLEQGWWKDDCGPLLAYQGRTRRPVALLRGKGQRYVVFDPVERTSRPLTPAVEATLHPEAVTWYRPLPSRVLALRDLLLFSLHGRGRDLVWMAGTAAMATLLGMLTPLATAVVMDSAIPGANRRLLLELGLALLAAAFGQVLFRVSQAYLAARMSARARQAGQSAVWDRLLNLRPAFFRGFASGDLSERAMAVHQIGERLSGATLAGLFSGLMALLNLALLLYYSPRLALLAVGVAVLTGLTTAVSAALIRRRAVELQEANGALTSFKLQVVQGASKLRVAGAEPRAYTQWLRRYAEPMRLTLGIARVADGAAVANLLLSSLSTAALFWFGYDLLAGPGGELSIGMFLAFMAAYGTFLAGASGVSNTLVGLLDTLAAGKRVQPILAAEPESSPAFADPGLLAGRFSAEHVTFRYREDGPEILKDVSLRAEPGEFVALVGPSGSGKSTLLRMLLGFERPEAGGIYYDGMDLGGIDVRAVRRQLGVVLQGSRLSQGTILENLMTGAQVSLDAAWDAVRKAGFEEDLRALPMGMHTVVSEGGTNLSGGQRQRVLIARALLYRPKVLFFDEATSALDNRTQAIVSESLKGMNVTRLVIAHRLGTIRKADRIYVLDRGRVVEQGSFDELREAGGLFARMMARQQA